MRRKPRGWRACWVRRARLANSIAGSPTASRRAMPICRRRGSLRICGRPRWTSSRAISRIMRRTRGSWAQKMFRPSFRDAPAGADPESRNGICLSRFRVRCFASPRSDRALFPRPFRRALFRKRLRPLDIILRRHHRLDGGVFTLLGNRLLQPDRKALLNGLLGSADRHRAVLANGLRPALRRRQRFACRYHLVDEAEFVAFAGADMAGGEDHAHGALWAD